MPTFDDLARRAADELHEQVRPHVRVDPPALPTMPSRPRHRSLIFATAALVVAVLVVVSTELNRPSAPRISPSLSIPVTSNTPSSSTPTSTTDATTTTTTTTTVPVAWTQSDASQVVTIDGRAPAMQPSVQVVQATAAPGIGAPAAAFVRGVGLLVATAGDANGRGDLAIIDGAASHKIGVRVHTSSLMVGGPDGRLYVLDDNTLAAYTISGGTARLAGAIKQVGCEALEFPAGAAAVYCGDAKLPLGPVEANNGWAHFNSGHIWGYPAGFPQPSAPAQLLLASPVFPEPFEQGYDLANGTRLWLLPFALEDGAGGASGQTAVVVVAAGRVRVAQIGAAVAAVDLEHHVIYGWDPSPIGAVTSLRTYDYTSMIEG